MEEGIEQDQTSWIPRLRSADDSQPLGRLLSGMQAWFWKEYSIVMKIVKSREVASSLDQVWDAISNLDNERKHWSIIKDIIILKRDGNTIEREATIMRGPIGNVKTLQTLILRPKTSTILRLTQGPFIGTRKILLNSLGKKMTRIDVIWEFEPEGIPEFAHSFVKNNLSRVTENALTAIARDASRL